MGLILFIVIYTTLLSFINMRLYKKKLSELESSIEKIRNDLTNCYETSDIQLNNIRTEIMFKLQDLHAEIMELKPKPRAKKVKWADARKLVQFLLSRLAEAF